jgi:catechol 2,3-dioxygenase-like lactoylglutathione lyase family enzyme
VKSRAPLLELTLFVDDLDTSVAFFRALGFDVERWPGAESTTADVTLGALDAPLIQLFQANDTHPPSRVQLGFQVADVAVVAEALDASGFRWTCDMPNRLGTWWQGNKVNVAALDPVVQQPAMWK